MHWKHHARDLEWIVRQMSWKPPWTDNDAQTFAQKHPSTQARNLPKTQKKDTAPSNIQTHDMPTPCMDVPETPTLASPVLDPADDLDERIDDISPVGLAESNVHDIIPHPQTFWWRKPRCVIPDAFGYGRIPGVWFTLNLPFNYLYEIHRFQRACALVAAPPQEPVPNMPDIETCLHDTRDAMSRRCSWVLDNADIVVTLHAIRVELLLHYVMSQVVPNSELYPFLYWLRFEFGNNGNPHVHGIAYLNGNPEFDMVVENAEELEKIKAQEQQGKIRFSHAAELERGSRPNRK